MRMLLPILALGLTASLAAAQPPAPKMLPAPADVAAPPADAVKAPSGLASKVLSAGQGTDRPVAGDLVMVEYSGWTTDGKMFDSTTTRGRPSVFGVDRVIPGFSEGIQLMVPGERRRLWIPEAIAYKGADGRPAGMLVFDVHLLGMPNRPPSDVAAPPADATTTRSGLAYKVLTPGTGARHPRASDTVTVIYTGWTTDGKMFDTAYLHGGTSTFPLNRVIEGWTEGVQLMVEGEKTRFWIPERIAYKGKSAPFGMLVFDIELLRID